VQPWFLGHIGRLRDWERDGHRRAKGRKWP
jgi:hypothetical protein